MKRYSKIISIICLVCMLLSSFPGVSLAEDVWDGYSMTGAEIASDGSVKITSSSGEISSIAKTMKISSGYTLTTQIRVNSFSNETGIQVTNGKKRLFVKLLPGGVGINASTLSYKVGNDWHSYIFEVSGSSVNLYIDNIYIGKGSMQDNTTAARLYFWTKSAAGTPAVMQVKSAELKENDMFAGISPEKVTGKQITPSFYQPWDDVADWELSSTAKVSDGILTVERDEALGVRQALKNITLPENFNYEFRLKVNTYSDGETGSKIEWSPYRIFLYFKEDRLISRTINGNVSTSLDVGYDWHTWRAEVRGSRCSVYMDDMFVISYEMEHYSLDQGIMTYWVKPKDADKPSLSVDWTRFDMVKEPILQPLGNSTYVAGTEIELKADREAQFVINGTEYDGNVWKPMTGGDYSLYARYANGETSGAVTVTVVDGYGVKPLENSEIAYGEPLFLGGRLYNFTDEEISTVQYFVDGKEIAGDTAYDLKVGSHRVQAKVRLASGEWRLCDAESVVVTGGAGALTGAAYELEFTAGDGRILNNDGTYSLDISLADGLFTAATPDGKTERPAAARYKICVDYGQALVYEDGKYAFCFTLPRTGECGSEVTGEISDFKAGGAAGKDVFFAQGAGAVDSDIVSLSQNWALEFNKKDTGAEKIAFYDSGYFLDMTLDGNITVQTAPISGETVEDTLGEVKAGLYRLVSSRGICRLYIDDKFVGSFRLAEYVTYPHITRTVADGGTDFTVLRSTKDVFYHEDNFTDASYWNGVGSINAGAVAGTLSLSGSGAYVLSTSANNPQFGADVTVPAATGKIGVYLKYYSDYMWTRAVYDTETRTWTMEERWMDRKTLVTKSGSLPIGEEFRLSASVDGSRAAVWVNGEEAISCDSISGTYHARLGFYIDGGALAAKNFYYCGDSKASAGFKYFEFNDSNSMDFIELEDGLYMIGGGGASNFKRSTDGGLTWQSAVNTNALTSNTLKLKSGNILTITRKDGTAENTYWDYARLSTDGGRTFSGSVRIENRVSNRITMNNKLTELSDGRVIFCVGETGHGKEDYGQLGVYYSDDEGRSWQEGSQLTIFNTGVNVQEGKIIELPDGTLRCYMRTDRGFLYYSDSHDRGATWELELTKSEFPSPLNAMNIERDPYEENTYYMFWEYDNKNADMTKQYPRRRSALAVSRDGCESWQYVMDVIELDYEGNANVHANQGIRIFKDYIWLCVCSYEPHGAGARSLMNRVFRLERSKLTETGRFSELHTLGEAGLGMLEKTYNSMMVLIDGGETAIVGGNITDCDWDESSVDAQLFARSFGYKTDGGRVYFGDREVGIENGRVNIARACEVFGKTVGKYDGCTIISDKSISSTMERTVYKMLGRTAVQ